MKMMKIINVPEWLRGPRMAQRAQNGPEYPKWVRGSIMAQNSPEGSEWPREPRMAINDKKN